MTALSAANPDRPKRGVGVVRSYPVNASSVIYQGGLVAIDSTGNAVAATDSASDLRVVGVAFESATGGASDGDVWVKVESGAEWLFTATGITQAMLGTEMQVTDDNTIDDDTTNDAACGYLQEFVSTTSGWLHIPDGGILT